MTDKLPAYPNAIKNSFGNKVEHLRYKGFVDSTQNNKIERFHGTFRERDKVMRDFKSVKTAQQYNEAFRLYYNFIRKHSTIGTTPAEMAKIDLELGRNRWMNLLEKCLK